MAYTTQDELEKLIPAAFLVEATDGDGVADAGVVDGVIGAAQDEVDGALGQRFAVPFADSSVPPLAKQAAKIFALEALYLRRGYSGEQNPWSGKADALRTRLRAVAAGDEALSPAADRQKPSASVVSERSKTHSSTGSIPI